MTPRYRYLTFVFVTAGCSRSSAGIPSRTDPPVPVASQDAAPVVATIIPEAGTGDASLGSERWARYWAAMKRGRSATVQKQYSEAVAAFTEALTAVPRDARAMSERGYAKFLAGDNAGAGEDLDNAVDRVPATDKKLAAQIYFNEGLVADKAGASEAAAGYYRQSYELNPTAAAKAKMSSCPVLVEALRTRVFADRKAALASIAGESGFQGWDEEGRSDNVVAATTGGFDRAYAVLQAKAGFAVVATDEDVVMGAKGRSATVVAERVGAEWVVTGQAQVPGDSVCVPNGACMATANVEGGSHDVYYVDAATGAGLWHVAFDYAFVDRIAIAVEEGKLHVTGAGCDLVKPR